MKIFPDFIKNSQGVQFFVPDDEKAYSNGKPCHGFGMVRYGEGSVYCGGLYFDGAQYNKLGLGRQDFTLSLIGDLNRMNIRKAFFCGGFDYRETDWIYGNGVLYYTDANNKPYCFVKGFFEGVNKVGEYVGDFDYSSLSDGYTPDMEKDIDDYMLTLKAHIKDYENVLSLENLFIGDSYFDLWGSEEWAAEYAGVPLYKLLDNAHSLNLGVGGSKFSNWDERFIEEFKHIAPPERIFINLGFNDIHANRSAERVLKEMKHTLSLLRKYFPDSKYVLLNVVKSPSMAKYYAEEERFNEMTKAAADELGYKYIDMRSLVGEREKEVHCFSSDDLHLNPEGYKIMYKAVKDVINS